MFGAVSKTRRRRGVAYLKYVPRFLTLCTSPLRTTKPVEVDLTAFGKAGLSQETRTADLFHLPSSFLTSRPHPPSPPLPLPLPLSLLFLLLPFVLQNKINIWPKPFDQSCHDHQKILVPPLYSVLCPNPLSITLNCPSDQITTQIRRELRE